MVPSPDTWWMSRPDDDVQPVPGGLRLAVGDVEVTDRRRVLRRVPVGGAVGRGEQAENQRDQGDDPRQGVAARTSGPPAAVPSWSSAVSAPSRPRGTASPATWAVKSMTQGTEGPGRERGIPGGAGRSRGASPEPRSGRGSDIRGSVPAPKRPIARTVETARRHERPVQPRPSRSQRSRHPMPIDRLQPEESPDGRYATHRHDGGNPRQGAPAAGRCRRGRPRPRGHRRPDRRRGAVVSGLGRARGPLGACHLAHLAADLAGRRQPDRPELAVGGHPGPQRPLGGGRRPGRQHVGLPFGQRISGTGLAGPHRRRPDRLDSVGDPRRQGHRQRVRGRRQRRPTPESAATSPSANSGNEVWGQNAKDPNGLHGVQASMAVGNLNGVNSVVAPSLGQDEYAFNAGNGSILPGLALLHRRQRLHHPVAGRPLRQRADRGGRGRRLLGRAWPTARPTRPAAISGCWAPEAT